MTNHRNLTLHQDIRNVADRIAEADLAIGAGGAFKKAGFQEEKINFTRKVV